MAIDGPLGTPAIDAAQRNLSDLDRALNGDVNVTARPVDGNPGKTLIPYTQIVSAATDQVALAEAQASDAADSATEAANSASSIDVPAGQALATVAGSVATQVRTNAENDATFVPLSSRDPIVVWSKVGGAPTRVTAADILASSGHVVQRGIYTLIDTGTNSEWALSLNDISRGSHGVARTQLVASTGLRVTASVWATSGVSLGFAVEGRQHGEISTSTSVLESIEFRPF